MVNVKSSDARNRNFLPGTDVLQRDQDPNCCKSSLSKCVAVVRYLITVTQTMQSDSLENSNFLL